MEKVLAGLTSLIGHLLVTRNDRVADGTFSLSLESAGDIFPEDRKAINDGAVLEEVSNLISKIKVVLTYRKCNDTLRDHEPTLPCLLTSGNTIDSLHFDAF